MWQGVPRAMPVAALSRNILCLLATAGSVTAMSGNRHEVMAAFHPRDRLRRQTGNIVIDSTTSATDITALIQANMSTANSVTISSTTVTTPQLEAVLQSITAVSGAIQFNGLTVTSISMPSLRRAGSLSLVNCRQVTAVRFGFLANVSSDLTLQNLYLLTGTALSTGFPSLAIVTGQVRIQVASWSGGRGRWSTLLLPQLRAVGSLYIRQSYITGLSFPALTTVGRPGQSGQFYIYYMPYLRSINMVSLTSVTGPMTFSSLASLSSLCGIGLPRAGYLSSSSIAISGTVNLVQAPQWITTNASLADLATCSSLPNVVIHSATDFNRFAGNATLVNAAQLGSVVITWLSMSNSQLATVLQGKTFVQSLVLEGLADVTSLSPALDNLTTVGANLAIDNSPRVTTMGLPALTSVGGRLEIFWMQQLVSIDMQALRVAGSVFLYYSPYVTTADFGSLVNVTGGMTIQQLYRLGGTAITNGLPSLSRVGGELRLRLLSWSGPSLTTRTPLLLPQLQSVGALYLYQLYVTAVSFPALTAVGGGPWQTGRVYLNYLPNVRTLNLNSLSFVTGRLTISSFGSLSTLCQIGLNSSGYHSSDPVVVSAVPSLVQSPLWITNSSGLDSIPRCTGLPNVVIASASDFDTFRRSSALTTARNLGDVVITWSAISNSQFATVLSGKTSLTSLVVEQCAAITTLRPALDNISTITGNIVLDNLRSLLRADAVGLRTVGGTVRIYGNSRLSSLSMPQLQTAGGLYIYNSQALQRAFFGALSNVSGDMTLRYLGSWSGPAIGAAFPQLQSVGGQLMFYFVSWYGNQIARSQLFLPQLRSVGSWYISRTALTTVSCPALTTIGGGGQTGNFYWQSLSFLRNLHFESLSSVSGRITFDAFGTLSNLCHFGLNASGYQGSQAIRVLRSPNIAQAPAWLVANANITSATPCTGLPGVVINTAADFARFQRDANLRRATRLGPVVVTWPAITNAQLASVLQGKTEIGGLVLESLSAITTLRPAVDALINVTAGIAIDNLPSLQLIAFRSLQSVAGEINVYGMNALRVLSIPALQSAGGLSLQSSNALSRVTFASLITIHNDLTLRYVYGLSGAALSAAFPALQSVGGQFYGYLVSYRGTIARTPMVLPQLRSVGSWYWRRSYTTAITCPLLASIGSTSGTGTFVLLNLPRLRSLHLPILSNVTGDISLTSIPSLSTLCDVGLQSSGYRGGQISISSAANLVAMAPWMAANVSRGATECSTLPAIIIHSATDYSQINRNRTLLDAAEVGSVVITWSGISTAQLSELLQRKTSIRSLVIEGTTFVSTLSPALDNLTSVSGSIVFDRLVVSTVSFPSLTSVGGGVEIFDMSRLSSVSMPNVREVQSLYFYNNRYLTVSNFGSLSSINGSLTFINVRVLSGQSITNGFPSLQDIGGQFYARQLSYTTQGRRVLSLPQLQSVGGWYMRYSYVTSVHCPAMATVGDSVQSGLFYWDYLPYIRSLHFPSLTNVSGPITFSRMAMLSNLCEFGVQATGYGATTPVRIAQLYQLVSAPSWISQSSGYTNVSNCSGLLPIVIHSADDYINYIGSRAQRNATEAGAVVITWPDMTDSELAVVLQGKTALDSLIVEGCSSISDVTSAVANLTSVASALVIDDLDSVTSVSFPSLLSIGGGLQVYNMIRITEITMAQLQQAGNVLLYNSRLLTRANFGSLTTVNGSLTMRYMHGMSGTGITTAFSALRSVRDDVYFHFVSWTTGVASRSVVSLPQLTSVGTIHASYLYITALHCAALTTVGGGGFVGRFYLNYLPNFRSAHFPSLTTMTGPISLTRLPLLSNLCHFGLQQAGYQSQQRIQISTAPHLSRLPAWIVRNTGLVGATICSGAPSVVIHTATDYSDFVRNATLVNTTQLGAVVITWSIMSTEQLTTVLQGKTDLDSLIIENCATITTLRPALGNLTTIGSSLALDNLGGLQSVEIPLLRVVGSILQVYSMPQLLIISMPQLQSVGGSLVLSRCQNVRTAQMSGLRNVNGSLSMYALYALSGTEVSSGLSSLESVVGELKFYIVSWSGSSRTSSIVLPQLRSVGSWYVRNTYATVVSAPILSTVGGAGLAGTFYWSTLPSVQSIAFPALRMVTGRISMSSAPRLSTLCQIGLPRAGYLAQQTVYVYNCPRLVFAPTWLSVNAGLRTTSPCPTSAPTTASPSSSPTRSPSARPTQQPTTMSPTAVPSFAPTSFPTPWPTATPSARPTDLPSSAPTQLPSTSPTADPTASPSKPPTAVPSDAPTAQPSATPSTAEPTHSPTFVPTCLVQTFSPTAGKGKGKGKGSTGAAPSLQSSGLTRSWTIVVVLLLVGSLMLNAFLWKRLRSAQAGGTPEKVPRFSAPAFENPLYDAHGPSPHAENSAALAEAGYMDVAASLHRESDIANAVFDMDGEYGELGSDTAPGQSTSGEYMDVPAPTLPGDYYNEAEDAGGLYSDPTDIQATDIAQYEYNEVGMHGTSVTLPSETDQRGAYDECIGVEEGVYIEASALSDMDDVFHAPSFAEARQYADGGYCEIPPADIIVQQEATAVNDCAGAAAVMFSDTHNIDDLETVDADT